MPHHIVAFTYGLWGHLRPQIAFISRLIMAEPDIRVTMVFDAKLMQIDKVKAQLALDLEGKDSFNVQFYTLSKAPMFDGDAIEAEFKEVYAKILAESAIAPDVFLGEMGTYDTGTIVRNLSKQPVKIVFWYPGPLTALWNNFHRWGDDIDELFNFDFMAMASYDQNKELPIHGFPTISGNELFPQPITSAPPFPIHVLAAKSTQMWKISDAMLGGTSEVLESQQAAFLRSCLKTRGSELFTCGDNNRPIDNTSVNQEITQFLDQWLEKKGACSVLYIGFGSLTTHDTPEKFHVIMNVILDLGIPFVLAHPAHAAPLPTEISDRITQSGLGLVIEWAPQQYVLSHEATGWFLSHCGFTSTKESLSAGVPIIGWPLQYDQPLLAILVEQVLKCGYELEQVRAGALGLQKRKSNGRTPVGTMDAVVDEAKRVFTKAFFDEKERAEKFAVADKLKKELDDAWAKGGISATQVEQFLQFV
ncbi:hypothetical protein CPB85DRAFT_1430178 [Mucidula mucida]|nr:hypothetical protein CPB85DRAFT_1430178 [Mucidula mucida]